MGNSLTSNLLDSQVGSLIKSEIYEEDGSLIPVPYGF